MTDDITKFLDWKSGFSWQDDGPHAFRAIEMIEAIRFEMATRSEGYVGRIQKILDE